MDSIRLPTVESRTLDNGLRVLAVRDQKLPLVTIVLMVGRGAEADEEGKGGQADLTLEMLTLGTEKRSSEQIALDVDSLGARLVFSSGWDASFVEIEGLSEDLRSQLEILSDIVAHPTFPRDEFDQLKERRIAGLIQDQDESGLVADVQFTQLAFDGTPYGHPRQGTVESVGRICIEELQSFHNLHFLAGQCTLVVVGDVEIKEVFLAAEEFLGVLRGGSDAARLTPFSIPKRSCRQIRLIDRPDLTQSQIRMGHPAIERTNPVFHTFQVANYILGGGGFSSRLMERIRSQRGYTYGISSDFRGRRGPGPFLISTFTPTEKTTAVVYEILEVIGGFIEEGATAKELDDAKSFYLGSYPFRFESYRKIAREILEVELFGLGLQSLADYPEKISSIGQEDIQRVAKQHLFPEIFSVVIVGNAEVFKRDMDKIGPVGVVDFQSLIGRKGRSSET